MKKQFMMFRKKYKKYKLSNVGGSLVGVLVIIALVGMLAITCMYMSYANYVMKVNDYQMKNNFYSAESVLDLIHEGIEIEVSTVLQDSFMSAAQQMTVGETDKATSVFRTSFLKGMAKRFTTPAHDNEYFIGSCTEEDGATGLYRFLNVEYQELAKNAPDASGVIPDATKGYIRLTARNGKNDIEVTNHGYIFKNLVVEYMDNNGSYSEIKTDIMVSYPSVYFSGEVTFPDIDNCCLIANNGIEFVNAKACNIAGSVYAGAAEWDEDENNKSKNPKRGGIYVDGDSQVTFSGIGYGTEKGTAEIVASGGINVNMGNPKNASLGTSLTFDKCEIWTDNIAVNSSEMLIKDKASKTYVADDLTLYGTNNQVSFSGSYIGFGDGNNYAEDAAEKENRVSDYSSAMIVNAKKSKLDMSNLSQLYLAGNAYLNPDSYDKLTAFSADYAGKDTNEKNILVGNSIALKSDQLAYLIPRTAIGVYDGRSVIGKNPMNSEEYWNWLHYADQFEAEDQYKYKKVDYSVFEEKYGIYLSEYPSASYQVISENRGTGKLYYVYLTLDYADSAKYFAQYSQVATQSLEKYVANYENKVILPKADSNVVNKGNLMSCAVGSGAAASFRLLNYGIHTASENMGMSDFCIDQYNSYVLMKSVMTVDATGVTAAKKNNTFFENMIDVSAIESIGGYSKEYGSESGKKVLVVNNAAAGKAAYEINSNEYALIIASGDVVVNKNFNGLIISGGHITVKKGKNIEAIPANIKTALSQSVDSTNTVVGKFFVDGAAYNISTSEQQAGSDYTDVKDLVTYENWEKQ